VLLTRDGSACYVDGLRAHGCSMYNEHVPFSKRRDVSRLKKKKEKKKKKRNRRHRGTNGK
jgi:hypothetical protein